MSSSSTTTAGDCSEPMRILEAFSALSHGPAAYVCTQRNWLYANGAAARLFGSSKAALIGQPIAKQVVDLRKLNLGHAVDFVLRTGDTYHWDVFAQQEVGAQKRWLRLQVTPDYGKEGKVMGVFVMGRDVHTEKTAQSQAYLQNELISQHLDNGFLAFIQMSREFRIERWSGAAERIFGYTANEIMGRTPQEMCGIHPDDLSAVLEAWHTIKDEGPGARTYVRSRNFTKSGDWVWCDWYGSLVIDADTGAETFLCFAIDVTDRVEARDALILATKQDALTGLPNRYAFYEHVTQQLSKDAAAGRMLFIDLDGFREINEKHGHIVGDELLSRLAVRLSDTLGSEYFAARYGGDEFVLFAKEAGLNCPVDVVATKVLNALRRPFELDHHITVQLSCSVGMALAPEHGRSAQALLTCAEMAMYESKSNGRDQVYLYSHALGTAQRERLQLQSTLREAVRNQAIEVFYQPRISIATGKVIGAEALARWRQADGSLLSPQNFIPIAEDSGIIHELGAHVLKQACTVARAANAARNAAAAPFVVSVNLSTVQLRHAGFLHHVEEILILTHCKPQWIEFEVTESRELTDAGCVARLNELVHTIGTKCSLDDFGTGYSNLVELTSLPIFALKLDRDFINAMCPGSPPVVAAVLALAKSLGLETVAEGVENQAQLDLLAELGCTAYQGFFHSRPMPRDALLSEIGMREKSTKKA
jgi:diguanylate cyclase (GGDEF)-like protein/PAS domain S-box-containing protein